MSTSIPKTMKGVLVEKTGGPEVLQYKTDLHVPEPKEGQILVKNEFIGINYIDTYFRTGLYPSTKPEILGREASGTLVALGPGSHPPSLQPGARVVWMGNGGYAEYSAVPTTHTIAIPDAVPTADACAALLQGLTALTLIREAHEVRKGDWVLVHAAAGGTGLWLCQLLRAVGARTIGTASTAEKRALAKEHGAEFVIDYSKEDFVKEVKEITSGQGCVAVFDGVGKATFDASLECVARKGSMVSFGNASGPVPPFMIARLTAKNAKLLRPTLYNYIYTREEFEKYTNELFDFVSKDKMDVRIHKIYPLEDVKDAHMDLEGRKTSGKLLLRP